MSYLKVANSLEIWLASIPVIFIVIWQAVVFSRKTVEAGRLVELEKKEALRALKIGAVSAIGPAFGVFVVMVGLMSKIGGPLAWMRLAIIGSAPAELAASEAAASAMGVQLGQQGFELVHFAAAAWVMALNGAGWLVVSALFTPQLGKINDKISGGNTKLLGVIAASAMCGAMSYLFGKEVIKVRQKNGAPFMFSAITAVVSMIILERLAKKYPALKEYNLGIAMIIAMVVGALTKNVDLVILPIAAN